MVTSSISKVLRRAASTTGRSSGSMMLRPVWPRRPGLGVAVDLLALGTGLDDVEVAVDDDDRVGRRLEHRVGDRRALVQLVLHLLTVRDVLAGRADPAVLAQRAPRIVLYEPSLHRWRLVKPRRVSSRPRITMRELVLGRLDVIGVDEVGEGHAAQFVEVPAQHVVPRRIDLDRARRPCRRPRAGPGNCRRSRRCPGPSTCRPSRTADPLPAADISQETTVSFGARHPSGELLTHSRTYIVGDASSALTTHAHFTIIRRRTGLA